VLGMASSRGLGNIGKVVTWPMRGVAKRPIRRVTERPIRKGHQAHVQIRAYLSKLDGRDERGSLPDEVGSPNPREIRVTALLAYSTEKLGADEQAIGKGASLTESVRREISWNADSQATEDTTRAAAAHHVVARMECRTCFGRAAMGSEARDGRRYGEGHKRGRG
jgi:hypothetical protein